MGIELYFLNLFPGNGAAGVFFILFLYSQLASVCTCQMPKCSTSNTLYCTPRSVPNFRVAACAWAISKLYSAAHYSYQPANGRADGLAHELT